MRNLHVIATVDPAGGGPIEGLKQMAQVLTEQGHTIEVASMDDPEAPFVKDFPLTVHALGPGKTALGFAPKLLEWLKKNAAGYDAVVANGLWAYNSYAVWKALRGGSTPYFVFTHGMLDPWFNQEYPLKKLKKDLFWRWGQYPVLRDATAVLFTSEEERLLARTSFRPYQVKEIVVKYGTPGPTGDVDELAQKFRAKHPEIGDKRFLVYLSRIHVKKGCDLLIEAFAEMAQRDPGVSLVMAGPDKTNWVPTLKSQAEALGIGGRIFWPGMLSGDDKWGAFAAAEAFVLPSHQENFGIVVAEALSTGTPVLISDKINIWREIQAAGAGIVAPDTLEGTRHLLKVWAEMSQEDRAAMAERARACFAENFDIRAAAACLLNVTRNGRDIP